jgi:hypothetical protein
MAFGGRSCYKGEAMTLPKRGSRPIEVDGRAYRWVVGSIGAHGLANLVIENAAGVRVYCEPTRVVGGDLEQYPVTPAEVTDIIRHLSR